MKKRKGKEGGHFPSFLRHADQSCLLSFLAGHDESLTVAVMEQREKNLQDKQLHRKDQFLWGNSEVGKYKILA